METDDKPAARRDQRKLTGEEYFYVVTASMVMPKERFVAHAKKLLGKTSDAEETEPE